MRYDLPTPSYWRCYRSHSCSQGLLNTRQRRRTQHLQQFSCSSGIQRFTRYQFHLPISRYQSRRTGPTNVIVPVAISQYKYSIPSPGSIQSFHCLGRLIARLHSTRTTKTSSSADSCHSVLEEASSGLICSRLVSIEQVPNSPLVPPRRLTGVATLAVPAAAP